MRSERDKGDDEIDAFLRFVKAANLSIDVSTIEKRNPPEPDLRCVHEVDGAIAFELVELCDPKMAKAQAELSGAYIRTSDPSTGIIAKKLSRKYKTNLPIELLCYTNGRIVTPDSHILLRVRPYLRSWRHVFRRAWLMGRKGTYEIWSI